MTICDKCKKEVKGIARICKMPKWQWRSVCSKCGKELEKHLNKAVEDFFGEKNMTYAEFIKQYEGGANETD